MATEVVLCDCVSLTASADTTSTTNKYNTALLKDVRKSTNLEQHELVQWVVPLHQEDARRQDTTQVFVTVVGISPHTAALATPRLRNLCRHHKLPVH